MGALYILLGFAAGLIGAAWYARRRGPGPEYRLFGRLGTAVCAWITLWCAVESWYHFTTFPGTVATGLFWAIAGTVPLGLTVAGVVLNRRHKPKRRKETAAEPPPVRDHRPDLRFWLSHPVFAAFYLLIVVAPVLAGAAFLFVSFVYLLGFGDQTTVYVTGVDPYQPSDAVGYYLVGADRHTIATSLASPGDIFTARYLLVPVAWKRDPVTDFGVILALLAFGTGLLAAGLVIRHALRKRRQPAA